MRLIAAQNGTLTYIRQGGTELLQSTLRLKSSSRYFSPIFLRHTPYIYAYSTCITPYKYIMQIWKNYHMNLNIHNVEYSQGYALFPFSWQLFSYFFFFSSSLYTIFSPIFFKLAIQSLLRDSSFISLRSLYFAVPVVEAATFSLSFFQYYISKCDQQVSQSHFLQFLFFHSEIIAMILKLIIFSLL